MSFCQVRYSRCFAFAAIAACCALTLSIQRTHAQCTAYEITQSTGTIVPGTTDSGNHADDGTTPLTLPFPVTFYGTTYTQALISSNGNLQFGTAGTTSYVNNCLPSAT